MRIQNTPSHHLRNCSSLCCSCRTWELPRHVPFEATKRLVQEYTKMWKNPALRCFELVVRENTDLLEKLLQDHFEQYIYLKKYISYAKQNFRPVALLMFHSELIFKERQRCCDEAQILLTKILRMEANPLFTQNADYIAEDSKWFSTYSNHRGRSSVVGSDTWTVEDEIRVMASVQAYFQVSYKASTFSLV